MVKHWFSFSALVKFNQYLTDTYRYIIAFYCSQNVFWLIFIIKVFIIKVTVKENSFAWNLQRDELLQCWKFREFTFQVLCNILITSAKKRGKVSIAITSSNFIFCLVFLGAPQGSILYSLFLISYSIHCY